MKCPKCGKDNPIGSKFCNGCGEKLSEQTETEERVTLPPSIFKDVPEPEPTEIKKPESKLKLFFKKIEEKQTLSLVIGIIICVIFFLIIVAVFSTCNSSTQVDSSKANTYSSASESSVTEVASDSSSNSAKLISMSDLNEKVDFFNINFYVKSEWKSFKLTDCYSYDTDNSIKLRVTAQEMSEQKAIESLNNATETYKHDYTTNRHNEFLGCPAWTYAYKTNDGTYYVGKQFYYNNILYSVGASAPNNIMLYCNNVYNNVIDSVVLQSANITVATEPETEPPTPEPTEPPTEAPTSITDTLPLIFSNDEFDIYFVSAKPYEYDDNETLVKFLINNKYNTQMTFQADTIILDGISYSDVIMSDPVSANSLGYIEATVEDCTNFNPSAVGGDLRFFDTIGEGATRGDINIPSTNIK